MAKTTQASLGWLGPDYEDIIVTNRTGSAVAIGDVEMLDVERSDAASTTNVLGTAAAGIANAVVPLLAAGGAVVESGIFGVAQQGAVDDARFRMRLRGYVSACAVSGTIVLATSVCGPRTAVENATVLTVVTCATDAARPHKIIFKPHTARTGAGTTDGWFDGINGFGYALSVTGLT